MAIKSFSFLFSNEHQNQFLLGRRKWEIRIHGVTNTSSNYSFFDRFFFPPLTAEGIIKFFQSVIFSDSLTVGSFSERKKSSLIPKVIPFSAFMLKVSSFLGEEVNFFARFLSYEHGFDTRLLVNYLRGQRSSENFCNAKWRKQVF